VGASFGVIIVLGPKSAGQVEVATFRTEGPYADGRRPDHVSFCTAEEDAQRRDFTINGMFYDPVEQRVLDFVGGERDLGAGVVRAIGDPQARFREDKLRMLRAVRFAATLDFQLDPVTAEAIRRLAPEIQIVSAERIAQELRKMLVHPHRRRAIELAADVGLLPVILPELGNAACGMRNVEDDHVLHMLALLQEPSFELAAAVLLHAVDDDPHAAGEIAAGICRRLRLSNAETARIAWLVAEQQTLTGAPQMSAARLKRLFARPGSDELLTLYRIRCLARNEDLGAFAFCEEFLQKTPRAEIDPPPLLTGDDLIALGLSPGPRFREMLDQVRDAQLNGEIHTRDDALDLVRKLGEAGA
jgi:poly(A) polymerase